jgi:hypothetical protein
MSTSRTREKADGELFKSTGIDDNATSTAITIDSNENVTIGADDQLNMSGSHNEGGALIHLKGTDTPAAGKNLGGLNFGNSTDASLAMIRGLSTASDAADMLFFTEPSGGAIEERMRIDSSGNVGIGTSSPLNALQIGAANPITMNGNYPDIHFNGYYAAPHYRAVTTGYSTRMAFNPSNGSLSFKVGSNSTSAGANYNPIERVTLDKDGHLLVGDGITLGNGQSYAAANTLDDYEEGTWTPTITNSTGSYNTQIGRYTKIGNLVYVVCNINTAFTNTGSIGQNIRGLPFTSENVASLFSVGTVFPVQGFNQANSDIAAQSSVNSTEVALYTVAPTTGINFTSIVSSTFGTTVEFEFSLCYRAA